MLRTFSKIYGLAGLRIGYGLTTPEIVAYLNRLRPPFNANSMAQAAAVAALQDEAHVTASRTLNRDQMSVVRQELERMGCAPLPSQTNFLYFDARRDGREVFQALLHEGVIVRHLGGQMLRVSIGLPDENQVFLSALARVLKR